MKNGNGDHRRMRAFTIVELLVSIAILGVLVAIILPAVQGSRESSRRMTCQNHLRQFGVALHNFESRQRSFPWHGGPLVRAAPRGPQFGAGFSAQAQLLADLDQGALASRYDFTAVNRNDGTNEELVPVFRCPSDTSAFRGINYRVCEGAMTGHQPVSPDRDQWGLFTESNPRSSSILDGLSQTVIMSERIRSDENHSDFRPLEDWAGSGALNLVPSGRSLSSKEMLRICESMTGPGLGFSGQMGWYWVRADDEHTEYNHVAPPNIRFSDCSLGALIGSSPGAGASFEGGMLSARSYHNGVVNCLSGDGAVRSVSDSIDLQLWRSLATIEGHESIGEF